MKLKAASLLTHSILFSLALFLPGAPFNRAFCD
jgi:hypothetical protein